MSTKYVLLAGINHEQTYLVGARNIDVPKVAAFPLTYGLQYFLLQYGMTELLS